MLTSTFARKWNVRLSDSCSIYIGPGRSWRRWRSFNHRHIPSVGQNLIIKSNAPQRRRRRRPRRLRTRCDSKPPPPRSVCLTRTIDRSRQSFHIILLPRGHIIITTISDLRVSLITAGKLSRIPNNNIIKRPALLSAKNSSAGIKLAFWRTRVPVRRSVNSYLSMYICIYDAITPARLLTTHTRFVYKPLFRRKCFTRNFSKRKSAVYLRRRMFIATIYRRKGFPTNER